MMKRLYLISIIILILVVAMAVVMIITHQGQFDQELYDTASKISSDTFNFVIYTDLHHDKNMIDPVEVYIPTLDNIKILIDRVRIDSIWNLGDIINGFYTTKDEAMAEIRDVTSYEDSVSPNIHRIVGNHDNNIQATFKIYNGLPETEVISSFELNEVLENTHSDQKEIHGKSHPTDYYVDFDQLRVVCLGADVMTFLPETAEWLKETALKTDKPVLFMSHIPTRPEWGFHNDVQNGDLIEEAIKLFIYSGGTVIAYIHGHDHGDMISTVTDPERHLLWHEVAIACSRFHVPKSNGTQGMTFYERNAKDETMLIFDVVSVDMEKRSVKFIRFGAGDDREITY